VRAMERHEAELDHEVADGEEEYERAFRGDHAAAVETLRAVVDGVADGEVELTDGPTVEVPTDRAFEVEVEYEREAGEHELELELEWHVPEEYGDGAAEEDGHEGDDHEDEHGHEGDDHEDEHGHEGDGHEDEHGHEGDGHEDESEYGAETEPEPEEEDTEE
jgi:amphi-Trp domain-containing protein